MKKCTGWCGAFTLLLLPYPSNILIVSFFAVLQSCLLLHFGSYGKCRISVSYPGAADKDSVEALHAPIPVHPGWDCTLRVLFVKDRVTHMRPVSIWTQNWNQLKYLENNLWPNVVRLSLCSGPRSLPWRGSECAVKNSFASIHIIQSVKAGRPDQTKEGTERGPSQMIKLSVYVSLRRT